MAPYDKRDDESGKFTPEFEAREFVKAIAVVDGLATTSAIADEVGCSHRLALEQLNELEDEGRVSSQMAGRAKVWSRA